MITKQDFEGQDYSKISLENAIQFAERLKESNLYFDPISEIHPDKQIALTWRNEKGIINAAFDERDLVTWAAYFPKQSMKWKGHFEIMECSDRTAHFCNCLKFLHSKSNSWPSGRTSMF